ncbi:magnesium transporter [archaeon]|nr:magnesium transporter [archaeon]
MISWKTQVKQSVLFLIAIALLSVFAGLTLEGNMELLTRFPTIVIIIPGFIGVCGGLASTFSCRLTSALQLGKYGLKKKRGRIIANAEATMISTLITFVILTSIAYAIGEFFQLGAEPLPFAKFLTATLLSAIIVVSLSLFLAIGVAYFTIRNNLDPDNFESPVLTTFSDLVGVITFISISSLIIM